MKRKIIIAHRGFSEKIHENTIKAFKQAIEAGSDMIEFDIRRTKDGIDIIYHDKHHKGKFVHEYTLDEIREKSSEYGYTIATLEETLESVKGKIQLDVELKEEGYEHEIIEKLLQNFTTDEFIITTFSENSTRIIKEKYPNIKVGLLLGIVKPENYLRTRFEELFPSKKFLRSKADFLAPNFRLFKFGFLRRANRRSIPVYVWTPNDEKLLRKFIKDDRIHGIITDRTKLAMSIQNELLMN